MPEDEAKKLVEVLTSKLEDVFALNRQRARLVDILISASAGDLAETEKELERTTDELFRSEAQLQSVSQQINNMLRLLLSMRRGQVPGVNARELAWLLNSECAGPVALFKLYDDFGNELGSRG
jgi:septal ring factor EnvC (AmiA/AmiB activator)